MMAYNSLHMLALAIKKGGSFRTESIRGAMYGLQFDSPAGLLTMNVNHWVSQVRDLALISMRPPCLSHVSCAVHGWSVSLHQPSLPCTSSFHLFLEN